MYKYLSKWTNKYQNKYQTKTKMNQSEGGIQTEKDVCLGSIFIFA